MAALKVWLSAPLLQHDLIHVSGTTLATSQNYLKSYSGNEGRRQSVLEFLATAIQLKSGGKLCLISWEEMSWLMEDPSFTHLWVNAVAKCIDVGYEITIIHTVKRSMDELYKAFMQWVPFYMTGKVKAYYMTENQVSLHVQTLFAVEDLLLCANLD